MRSSWKLLPLAALMALGAVLLFSGRGVGPDVALASHDNQITVSVDSDPEGGTGYDFTSAGTSTECDEDFTLDDDEEFDNLEGCDDGSYTISVDTPSHSDLQDINCSVTDVGTTAGAQSTTSDSVSNEEVDINISDNEHVSCLFDFEFDEDLATPTVSAAAGVTVASSFASLSCNSFSVITVTVRDGGGNPLPNVTLNVAASIGSVSPTQVTTGTGGAATTLYTAPATQGGTATVTATVASTTVSGSTTILINCAATPTATTVPPTATATRAPTTGLGAPSTGDGGLADGGGTGWPVYAGFVLTASALIGGVIAFRVRA